MKSFQMKKIAASTIVAAAMFAATIPAGQAAVTAPEPFTVSASLSAICTVAAIPDLAFGTYIAFGGAVSTSTPFSITCSRGLNTTPTYTFDAAKGGAFGVIAGLNYQLAASITSTSAGAPATATLGGLGLPDVHTVTITGNMPAGQAGDCAGGNATACATTVTDVRTVTITY